MDQNQKANARFGHLQVHTMSTLGKTVISFPRKTQKQNIVAGNLGVFLSDGTLFGFGLKGDHRETGLHFWQVRKISFPRAILADWWPYGFVGWFPRLPSNTRGPLVQIQTTTHNAFFGVFCETPIGAGFTYLEAWHDTRKTTQKKRRVLGVTPFRVGFKGNQTEHHVVVLSS